MSYWLVFIYTGIIFYYINFMIGKIRKYFEYSIFLLINIFFSSSGFSALFILGASAYLGNKDIV